MAEAIPYSPEIFRLHNRDKNLEDSFTNVKRPLFPSDDYVQSAHKRQRNSQEEFHEDQMSGTSSDYFGALKRSRINNSHRAVGNENQDSRHFFESQIAAVRSECRLIVDKKNQEIEAHSQAKKQLHDSFQALSNEHKLVIEENKILKRAVAIQENRHKDILNQNQQLQSILSQAVERIHGLQDTNKKLTEHIHILEYGSGYKNSMGGFPPPPPDVF